MSSKFGLGQFHNKNRIITLTVTALSGFQCILRVMYMPRLFAKCYNLDNTMCLYWQKNFITSQFKFGSFKSLWLLQWKPLNVIALVRSQSTVFANGDGTCKTDHINRMIKLSVITLSGFHCITIIIIDNTKNNTKILKCLIKYWTKNGQEKRPWSFN